MLWISQTMLKKNSKGNKISFIKKEANILIGLNKIYQTFIFNRLLSYKFGFWEKSNSFTFKFYYEINMTPAKSLNF